LILSATTILFPGGLYPAFDDGLASAWFRRSETATVEKYRLQRFGNSLPMLTLCLLSSLLSPPMAFLFFGYTQAFEGNKMGGRVFNDLFLIFWWTLPQSFAIRACVGMSKETLAIATAAMVENEVFGMFFFI
jgi:hypothetical protein